MGIEAGAGARFDFIIEKDFIFPDLTVKTVIDQTWNFAAQFT